MFLPPCFATVNDIREPFVFPTDNIYRGGLFQQVTMINAAKG